MEQLQTFVSHTQWPLLTAFVLGVLVALHPCPMATNVAAMGYIGRHVTDRRRVFTDGLVYTLGRTVSYSLIGAVLIALIRSGAELLHFGEAVSEWGERILGPLLSAIGLYLLYNDLLHRHDHVPHMPLSSKKAGPFVLGLLFALAFCPESGIVYFGMLIPMSVESSMGYLLPVAFAVGTGVPVILMACVFAFSYSSLARFSKGMQTTKALLTRIIAVLFISAGVFVLLN
jgi:cytochrome c biogenesis protein CcdA